MKIAIACDHGGFPLKEAINQYIRSEGHEIVDLGVNSGEASVDYPEYGYRCAQTVAAGEADRGVVICGTGIGISIAANKVKGVRCALCTSPVMAEMARRHNDADMLALGARILEKEEALEILKVWLETGFDGGRHQRRVDMLNSY